MIFTRFEGEDLATEARKKIQTEQQKAWLEQQMLERCRADKEREEAENFYHEALVARDQRTMQLDAMERECKRRLELANVRFNQALVGLLFDLFKHSLSKSNY